jgi:CHAT domain-containing protein
VPCTGRELTTSFQKAYGRGRPRLWWCVTGELGFLPIHAAGNYRDASPVCAADYVASSYIPTLSSLTKARACWEPIPRTQLGGLLVCEDSSNNERTRYLPEAAEEVNIVRACFESAKAQILNTPSAHTSLATLRSLLEETPAHILHLACHGIHDSDPLRSALVLQDGNLTIRDIMDLHLPNAVLAVLSACQTAKGDRNAPDQAVHLAASMLFCGFKSVIGTMW